MTMKTVLIIVLMILTLSLGAFAQQDPDDPGIQDSIIVGSTYVDTGGTFAIIPIYAVTDDSVAFYNLPIRWSAPQGGVYAAAHTQYFYPLTSWDSVFDSVVISQDFIRQVGWHDIIIDSIIPPPLYTAGSRVNIMSLRFVIDPDSPPQLILIDTCWDDRNQSMTFGLADGFTDFPPAFVGGWIAIYTGTDNDQVMPSEFSLSQNYPNPFNPTTLIEFALPQESHTQLVVYNLLGQTIKTIIDEVKAPGAYSITWDGSDNSGNPQPSGTYFYNLTTSNNSQTRRMTLIR